MEATIKEKPDEKIKITIGLPVYNAESFLQKKLDSLLLQTFSKFELIISDNGSTDDTLKICKEYIQKDKRIQYFRHEKNIGITWNFNFVLSKAKGQFFMWTAVDDIITTDFLEKNYRILSSNENLVASISKIKPYETLISSNKDAINKKFRDFIKKLRQKTRDRSTIPIKGDYNDKIRTYLKKSTCQVIYSLFRTEELKNSMVTNSFIGNDWAVFLNVLKYGDLHVIDEVLMQEYEGGITGKGIVESIRHYNKGTFGIIFPWLPLTLWVIRNLGFKIFFKNFDFFLQVNIEGGFSLLIDLIRGITTSRSRN